MDENNSAAEMQQNAVKINWRQKLSSRKLWAAALAAALSLIAAFFGEDLPAEMADVLKTGIYGLMAYIFGEGFVDVARIFGEAKVDAAGSVPINISFTDEEKK